MAGSDRDRTVALLGTVVVLVVVAALAWLGVRTGHLAQGAALGPEAVTTTPTATATAPAPTVTRTPRPSSAPVSVPPDPALAAAFAERIAGLGGEYALAWVDSEGVHLVGAAPEETAWSTVKVPLAVAAAARAPATETWQRIEAAVSRSDNDAALALWTALGPPEEAARAVDTVLDAYGSPETRTEWADVRPPFSSFGQTWWPTESQARFAHGLACVPDSSGAGRVRAAMGRVVADQRWGIGTLEAAHLKGGWGPDAGGAYVLRQLGDAEVAGQRYALALTARSGTGSHAHATEDATDIVRWFAETVAPTRPGLTCPAA